MSRGIVPPRHRLFSGRKRLDPSLSFPFLSFGPERSSPMKCWRSLLPGGWCLLLMALAGCGRSAAPTESPSAPTPTASSADASLDDRNVRVTGPYVHENLTVFLIHADQQDEGDFLTLDEGLSKGVVEITEKEQGQVRELVIDNKSDQPLYLQEGERIQGGKQDRIIASSLVIAAHSGKRPLPAFCVEQSRWREGKNGASFASCGDGSVALAPKDVRGAAKFEKEQGKIWAAVTALKVSANAAFMTPNTNSSINELLDTPKIQALSKEYATDLTAILNKHPDAVGVAIVVNGQFEEADIYPNHRLLGKLYPRLVQSYSVRAALQKEQAKGAPSLCADDIVAYLRKGPAKSQRQEHLDPRNHLEIQELDQNRFACTTNYEGRTVNYQVMKKTKVDTIPAQQSTVLSDW
jgi:hypothetical protein